MNTNLIASLKREADMQTENYNLAIERGVRMLMDRAEAIRAGGKPSTHLGHNLANVATDLAGLAAKIEQTENMIRWATTEEGK